MNISSFFKKNKTADTSTEITSLESVNFEQNETLINIFYERILCDVADRTAIPNDVDKLKYITTNNDSYSPYKMGLISIVVDALVSNERVYYRKKLIKDSILFVKLTNRDTRILSPNDADILELDFRNFKESVLVASLLKLLSEVLQAASNNIFLSKAMILKIHALSEMIANQENLEPLHEQIKQINKSLRAGNTGYIDAKSSIDAIKIDMKPVETASEYIFSMISLITGIPKSYMYSLVTGGLGDMSDSEERRLTLALKKYFNSIWAGVLYSVYNVQFQFKGLITDTANYVELFTWLETTIFINNKGIKKILLNNTILDETDLNIGNDDNEKNNLIK